MRRCSAVAWNPEVATQLVVACEDDLSPTLQLWDLRNSVAPLREFNAHDKARSSHSCGRPPSLKTLSTQVTLQPQSHK